MTTRIVLATVLATVLAAALAGCASLPPIRGKACYSTADGELCIGGDSQGIVIEGAILKSP